MLLIFSIIFLSISVQTWKTENSAAQDKQPLYENPTIFVEDIFQKVKDLDREMRYMVNKAKVRWFTFSKPVQI